MIHECVHAYPECGLQGDALLLTWGERDDLHHALIDLGRTGDYRALRLRLVEIGHFALFTISHIDADHIEGAMPLMKEATAPVRPADARSTLGTISKTRRTGSRATKLWRRWRQAGRKVSAGIIRFGWP